MLCRLIKPYVIANDLNYVIAEYELKNWNLLIIEKLNPNSYYLEFEYGY